MGRLRAASHLPSWALTIKHPERRVRYVIALDVLEGEDGDFTYLVMPIRLPG